jgi:hypothetical protein
MNDERIEGTIVFDGLLQGRLPNDKEVEARLREWVEFVGKLGLRFNFETRDSNFSLLPENRAVSVAGLGNPPEEAVAQAIRQLVELFPPPERMRLFSTLRSSEFRPGEEVQTVYSLAEGQTRLQSRTVDAETTPPPVPLTRKEQVKLAAMGLGLAVAFLGVAMLFPGVRAMFGQVADMVKPLDVNELKVETGPYAPYLTCTVDDKQSDRSALVLQLARKKAFPLEQPAAEDAAAADASLVDRLAKENLIRGYIRAELFDADGKYVTTLQVRLSDLRSREKIEGKLPLPEKVRITRVAFVL